MGTAIVVTVAGLATIGTAMGLYLMVLRLAHPGGVTASLRHRDRAVPGLSRRFRAGYAAPLPDGLEWRRTAWFGPGIRIPYDAIGIAEARAPQPGERAAIPPRWSIMPVLLPDGTWLDLALHHVDDLARLRTGRGPKRFRSLGFLGRFTTDDSEH